jgi:hypothetical protein
MSPWSSPMPMHVQSKALSFAACYVSIPHIAVMVILILCGRRAPTDQGTYE